MIILDVIPSRFFYIFWICLLHSVFSIMGSLFLILFLIISSDFQAFHIGIMTRKQKCYAWDLYVVPLFSAKLFYLKFFLAIFDITTVHWPPGKIKWIKYHCLLIWCAKAWKVLHKKRSKFSFLINISVEEYLIALRVSNSSVTVSDFFPGGTYILPGISYYLSIKALMLFRYSILHLIRQFNHCLCYWTYNYFILFYQWKVVSYSKSFSCLGENTCFACFDFWWSQSLMQIKPEVLSWSPRIILLHNFLSLEVYPSFWLLFFIIKMMYLVPIYLCGVHIMGLNTRFLFLINFPLLVK